ncbi:hypothetical protein EGW08_011850 [Elysia chlorotica]|uniref:Uncharacterized protein n=1 Tax=Elysia chlorotica TaxID=188477 RepID=A0A3S0ZLA6_ELYCH|nr:hypothetical protein EGW08_011850 [Elysia chlorotica]
MKNRLRNLNVPQAEKALPDAELCVHRRRARVFYDALKDVNNALVTVCFEAMENFSECYGKDCEATDYRTAVASLAKQTGKDFKITKAKILQINPGREKVSFKSNYTRQSCRHTVLKREKVGQEKSTDYRPAVASAEKLTWKDFKITEAKILQINARCDKVSSSPTTPNEVMMPALGRMKQSNAWHAVCPKYDVRIYENLQRGAGTR